MAADADSGIYEIVNLLNGKRYVGSAKSLPSRFGNHRIRLVSGKHHNRYLQKSWVKYGAQAFAFRVILICKPDDLIFFEQRAIDTLRPEYNLSPTAGSTLGVVFSEEAKGKMAASAMGRKRDPESVERGAAKLRGIKQSAEHVNLRLGNQFAKGYRHTDEWKRANSERHMGRPRPKSPEYRAKISATLKGVTHSPERKAKQAARQLGLKRKPYNIKPRTPEQQARIVAGNLAAAAKNRGKKRSQEVIDQMRISRKGRKQSVEQRAGHSIRFKAMWAERREEILAAQVAGRLTIDKTHLIETGKKLAAINKGSKRTPEQRAARSAMMLGKKRGPYKRPPPTA